MGRRALLVGIDHYDHITPDLSWCVGDALAMRQTLAFHASHDANFACRTLLGSHPPNVANAQRQGRVTFNGLRAALEDLFAYDGEVLFYFSGHGMAKTQGAYLVTQDGTPLLPGMLMNEVLAMANRSSAREVVLLLDCCYAGALGEPLHSLHAEDLYLREGITLIAASRPQQLAVEQNGHGVFTNLLLGGLEGGAADIRGQVSAAALYAYVEQALGPWDQRPIYKSNASRLTAIRQCAPEIEDRDLRRLPQFFPTPEAQFWLVPSYEATHATALPEHVAIFHLFKRYQVTRLLRPSLDRDLYFAALRTHPVELTPLGQFYRQLAIDGKLGSIQLTPQARKPHMPNAESVAKLFHEAYERLAPTFNYETRQETRVTWEEVPERNKRLMIAVAAEILAVIMASDSESENEPSVVQHVARQE